jgi:hypothetical protein
MLYFTIGFGLGAYFMSLYHIHDKNFGKVAEHAHKDWSFFISKIKELCQNRNSK